LGGFLVKKREGKAIRQFDVQKKGQGAKRGEKGRRGWGKKSSSQGLPNLEIGLRRGRGKWISPSKGEVFLKERDKSLKEKRFPSERERDILFIRRERRFTGGKKFGS